MGELVVFENVTLDGVAQGPGRPDEDTRNGFGRSGWAAPYAAPEQAELVGQGQANAGGIVLGRRTYEDFYGFWPKQPDNPFTASLNASPKYVASRTLDEPLAWEHSTLLPGDAVEGIRSLKDRIVGDLVVLGSLQLVHGLVAAGLVDRFTLLTYPLVLGTGRRLFPEGSAVDLRLLDTRMMSTGVVMATYAAT